MSKLRKRDETDRDTERERPGAAAMMSDESGNHRARGATFIGGKIGVRGPPNNKVHIDIQQRKWVS